MDSRSSKCSYRFSSRCRVCFPELLDFLIVFRVFSILEFSRPLDLIIWISYRILRFSILDRLDFLIGLRVFSILDLLDVLIRCLLNVLSYLRSSLYSCYRMFILLTRVLILSRREEIRLSETLCTALGRATCPARRREM